MEFWRTNGQECCNGKGDVRGMCFARIGDLTKMDDTIIQRVRKCPSKNYCIAWTALNNDCYKEWRHYFRIQALDPDWDEIDRIIGKLNGDDDKWCWRCIEDWEDEEGQEHEGEKVVATCEECGVCADCEHGMECSQSNNGVETAEDRDIACIG